ncbi:hypothetical protein [Streptomyces sp. NPDC051016]|uniref:hypothetical protein n=1 Tax=Streptomyces sp. NPDC051016 TaxID=3365638 RepID=UPI0037B1BE88
MSQGKQTRRNIDADYRDGMIREYGAYATSGRTEQAEHVAAVLLAEYDYDVNAEPEDDGAQDGDGDGSEKTEDPQAPETASQDGPEQAKTETPPQKTTQPRAAKKTTAAKPATK